MNVSSSNSIKKKISFKVLTLTALAISLCATALHIINYLFFYDKEIGYFSRGSVLPMIANLFYALAVIFFFASLYFLAEAPKSIPTISKSLQILVFVPASVMAVYSVSLAISIFQTPLNSVALLDWLLLIFAICSAVFFASFSYSKQPSIITTVTSVGFAGWLALSWIGSRFDLYVAINSPQKVFFTFGCIGALLFTVAELRALCGMSKPKFYCFSLFTGILFMALSSISSIACGYANVFRVNTLQYENSLLLALLIYAVARSIQLISQKQANEPDKSVQDSRDDEQQASEETTQN